MLGGGTLGTGFLGIWVPFTLGPWGAGYLGDGFSAENGAFGEIGGKFRGVFLAGKQTI